MAARCQTTLHSVRLPMHADPATTMPMPMQTARVPITGPARSLSQTGTSGSLIPPHRYNEADRT
ncbi:hypothetical protein [Faecalibaculum rodentium]|uniref:hypothetical protein n=1 Tax=Faecalibaculum rodentium TaxID=1702221 RepID=UPI000836E8F3